MSQSFSLSEGAILLQNARHRITGVTNVGRTVGNVTEIHRKFTNDNKIYKLAQLRTLYNNAYLVPPILDALTMTPFLTISLAAVTFS